jgi:hypothetical protein
MPTKTLAAAARLSAPLVRSVRSRPSASARTTTCTTPRWKSTAKRLPMKTITGSTWSAIEKPPSSSGPNTKRAPTWV